MLMSRCVIDDLRPVVVEKLKHAAAVPNRSDQHLKVEVRIFFTQFQLDIVGIVFIDIKDDELAGRMRGNLAAELAADGTASASDEDPLAFDEVEDLCHILFDWFPSQQVFHGDRLHF